MTKLLLETSRNLQILRRALRIKEKYWFLRKLSVLPGNSLAMAFQVEPQILCSSSSRLPSTSVHFCFDSSGSSLLAHLFINFLFEFRKTEQIFSFPSSNPRLCNDPPKECKKKNYLSLHCFGVFSNPFSEKKSETTSQSVWIPWVTASFSKASS